MSNPIPKGKPIYEIDNNNPCEICGHNKLKENRISLDCYSEDWNHIKYYQIISTTEGDSKRIRGLTHHELKYLIYLIAKELGDIKIKEKKKKKKSHE